MRILVYSLIASWFVEAAIFALPFLWKLRRFLMVLPMVLGLFGAAGLFAAWPNVFSGLVLLLGLYRTFNYFRILEQRMHERYLLVSTSRSAAVFFGLQLAIGLVWVGWEHFVKSGAPTHSALIIWLAVCVVTGVAVFVVTVKSIVGSRTLKLKEVPIGNLPTLSVCIPARNETDDLTQCLESLVASDYPKLEILVLDDCSQSKRTSEIIRAFAQSGVQFLAGTEPDGHWLAKNWAYEKLAEAASGELVLFCGVDTRFKPGSLKQIVSMLSAAKLDMMSVVPERLGRQGLSLIQPMRYFWEMSWPRVWFKRPAVLSTCWIIKNNALTKLGGFSAVTRKVVPEAYFARQLFKSGKYRFVRGRSTFGVSTNKPVTEQRATALRTRYPQLHKRPEWVLLLTLVEVVLFLAPFGAVVYGAVVGEWLACGLAAYACLMLMAAYGVLQASVVLPGAALMSASFPVAIIYDVVLLNISMFKYEFSVVEWKGRNVCLPAMHFTPHLQK